MNEPTYIEQLAQWHDKLAASHLDTICDHEKGLQFRATATALRKMEAALEYYSHAPWAEVPGVAWFRYSFATKANEALQPPTNQP